MKTLSKILIILFIATDIYLFGKILLAGKNFQILNPKGYIALQERDLAFVAIFLMLIVVIPVFIFAFYVATKYHAKNTKSTYTPDWDHGHKLQFFVWAFPASIIGLLCVLNWITAHKLDPRDAIASSNPPITIQVVALRWKWLFIYPKQNIATVNYVALPENTPVNFELTASDTPMNSFWIPQLGGQIYAMSGMSTQTHLIADGIGTYRGENTEINGAGYADMTFTAQSFSQSDFANWVASVKQSPKILSLDTFNALAQPTQNNPRAYYSSTQDNLYTTIVMKYMYMPHTSVPKSGQ
jgi:cytochrome o ubiquinol oxidase subunit 2